MSPKTKQPLEQQAKYILTGEHKLIRHKGRDIYLWQIRALRRIPLHHVEIGDLGGWIEKDSNLSQEGDCWVGADAKVFGDATVRDDAVAYEYTMIYDNADVYESACAYGNSKIFGNSKVHGHSRVREDAMVHGDSEVTDHAWIGGNADAKGTVRILGDTILAGNSKAEYGTLSTSRRLLHYGRKWTS